MKGNFKMAKTPQGYIPYPYELFVSRVIERYKGLDMFIPVSKCNCGKKKPPKK